MIKKTSNLYKVNLKGKKTTDPYLIKIKNHKRFHPSVIFQNEIVCISSYLEQNYLGNQSQFSENINSKMKLWIETSEKCSFSGRNKETVAILRKQLIQFIGIELEGQLQHIPTQANSSICLPLNDAIIPSSGTYLKLWGQKYFEIAL